MLSSAAMRQNGQVLNLDEVGLRYGQGPEILRDIRFAMSPGDFYFLTGPSGAGKSSLLRMLFLAQRPTRGSVHIFGEDVGQLTRRRLPQIRRRIGVVFQEFRLLDHLTTFDNVALPLRVAGQSESRYRRDVMDLLDWVGLADQVRAYPPVLSGGEKQRNRNCFWRMNPPATSTPFLPNACFICFWNSTGWEPPC